MPAADDFYEEEPEDQPESQLIEALDDIGFTDEQYVALARLVSLACLYPRLYIILRSVQPEDAGMLPWVNEVIELYEGGEAIAEPAEPGKYDLMIESADTFGVDYRVSFRSL